MARWMLYTKKADFKAIAEDCGISQVLARVIRNRDVVGSLQTRRFLKGGLEDLHDPCLLPDMEKAAGILCEKISAGEAVRVIGDYDVDGICASYILMRVLAACGAQADVVLPDRIRDGYGMNPQMADDAAQDGIGLILTCDNGIAAAEAVARAREAGICVVVTDHHEVPYEEGADGAKTWILPPADAVVDPKVRDPRTGQMEYPFPEICGAVVAWKLSDLLLQRLAPEKRTEVLQELLPFCALATVCDVMPLADENRILVREGLRLISDTKNIGLRSLLTVNGLEDRPITTYHAGFVIGPCLNATGRLDNAERALALFLEDDPAEALRSAQKLRELNDSRKSLTEQGVQNALIQISEKHLLDYRVMVIFLPDCHESLAGIIAGRIRERCSRPVFVLTRTENGLAKGSGRSIEAYDMFAHMTGVKECFVKFGGHKMAAGLSMREEDIPVLQDKLEETCGLSQEDLTDVIHIDMELPPSLWNFEMTEELRLLEPCGTANPRPVFAARGIRLRGVRVMGKGRNVLGFEAVDQGGRTLSLTWFCEADVFEEKVTEARGAGAWRALQEGRADLTVSMVYHPEINEWRGRRSLRYVIRDMHF
ncbi:MAG: single-stranded-DNA-specific exonuclease RecJ [Lachnospiraceae bacterium]|nr:single-stranded-DNA-specific exonuclease RecJ [Lachnospiraceae bacterium]